MENVVTVRVPVPQETADTGTPAMDGVTPDAPPPPDKTALTKQPPLGTAHGVPVDAGVMEQARHVPYTIVACDEAARG